MVKSIKRDTEGNKKMILFKDYRTGKKSLTMTCVIISTTITWVLMGIEGYHAITGQPASTTVIWPAITLTGLFSGMLWNKRVRAGSDGISIESEEKNG